jgi:hypothetical protein
MDHNGEDDGDASAPKPHDMIIYVILMAKASIKRKQSRKQLQNKQE